MNHSSETPAMTLPRRDDCYQHANADSSARKWRDMVAIKANTQANPVGGGPTARKHQSRIEEAIWEMERNGDVLERLRKEELTSSSSVADGMRGAVLVSCTIS